MKLHEFLAVSNDPSNLLKRTAKEVRRALFKGAMAVGVKRISDTEILVFYHIKE